MAAKSQKMPSDRPLTVVQVTPVSRMAMYLVSEADAVIRVFAGLGKRLK